MWCKAHGRRVECGPEGGRGGLPCAVRHHACLPATRGVCRAFAWPASSYSRREDRPSLIVLMLPYVLLLRPPHSFQRQTPVLPNALPAAARVAARPPPGGRAALAQASVTGVPARPSSSRLRGVPACLRACLTIAFSAALRVCCVAPAPAESAVRPSVCCVCRRFLGSGLCMGGPSPGGAMLTSAHTSHTRPQARHPPCWRRRGMVAP